MFDDEIPAHEDPERSHWLVVKVAFGAMVSIVVAIWVYLWGAL